MALKALLLRKKIDDKKAALEELRAKDADFARREAELETAIGEAESDEDKQSVEGLVNEFEGEKKAHEESKTALEGEVAQLEQDLAAEEAAQPTPPPANNQSEIPANTGGERKDEYIMSMKRRGFMNLDCQQRDAFLAREDIKTFLQQVRELGKTQRDITGADLTIPDVMLDLVRENISYYSKLISVVNLQVVPGTARQNIMGTVPEAVWTEACAKLNELSFCFTQIEVDGYKVGGFIAVCNAILQDSDVGLASVIMDVLGQAIGKALDKAILYGTGLKMPMGVMTRLAQTAKPATWGTNAPDWADLHTSNLQTITGKSGLELFRSVVLASGAARSRYSRNPLTWVANEGTKAQLVAEAMAFNAAGAIVSAQNDTMPVAGGRIVTLEDIPDGDIIFGHFDLYLLVQRAGAQLAQSEHVRFIEEQTVFKGTARYDGIPVDGKAFGAVNIDGKAPTTSVTFPPDKANAVEETP